MLRNSASTTIVVGAALYRAVVDDCPRPAELDVDRHVKRYVFYDNNDNRQTTTSFNVLIDDIVVNFVFRFSEASGSTASLTALTPNGVFYAMQDLRKNFADHAISKLNGSMATYVERMRSLVTMANGARQRRDYYLNVNEHNAITGFRSRRLTTGVDDVSAYTLVNGGGWSGPYISSVGLFADRGVSTVDVLVAAQRARYDLCAMRPTTFAEVVVACNATGSIEHVLIYEDAEAAVIATQLTKLTWMMIDGMPTYIPARSTTTERCWGSPHSTTTS